MTEIWENAYECGNKNCWYFKRYRKRFHWYSPESDLKKIKWRPECGESEKIYRHKSEDEPEESAGEHIMKYMVG